MRNQSLLLVPLSLSAALSAQTVVSPAFYANAECPGATTSLFYPGYRWQQLHTDLKGAAKGVKSLAFRRDALAPDNAGLVARTVECEVKMAHGSASLTTTYASNFVGAATTVLAKKLVSSPDWTKQ